MRTIQREKIRLRVFYTRVRNRELWAAVAMSPTHPFERERAQQSPADFVHLRASEPLARRLPGFQGPEDHAIRGVSGASLRARCTGAPAVRSTVALVVYGHACWGSLCHTDVPATDGDLFRRWTANACRQLIHQITATNGLYASPRVGCHFDSI